MVTVNRLRSGRLTLLELPDTNWDERRVVVLMVFS